MISDIFKNFINSVVSRERATHAAQPNAETLYWLEAQPGPSVTILIRQAMGGHKNGSIFSVNGGATWHGSISEAVRQEIVRSQLGV